MTDRYERRCPVHRGLVVTEVPAKPGSQIDRLHCPEGHFTEQWLVVDTQEDGRIVGAADSRLGGMLSPDRKRARTGRAMLKASRYCPRCKDLRPWSRVLLPGARFARRACIICGATTRRVKHRRKKTVMPTGLYAYREHVAEADALWRKLIYAKTEGMCAVFIKTRHLATCRGERRGVQGMHLFPKGKYPHIRHDPDNGAPGCPGCHLRLTNDHEAHREFCIAFLGPERYESLRLRSISRAKTDVVASILLLKTLLEGKGVA